MSGYPDSKTFVELMHLCADCGVDLLEIGMPFSDPSADGVTIKIAGTHALKQGTTTKDTINSIKEFRKTNQTMPLVWMGYYNSIFNHGSDFIKSIEEAGFDGILNVDLPVEEFNRLPKTKLDIIRLITPTTDDKRIDYILDNATGFIYFVSIKGTTGTKEIDVEAIKPQVEYIKSKTNLPVFVGFGIRNAQKASEVLKFSDGVVIGSKVIKIIEENIDNKEKMFSEVREFLNTFKK